MSQRVSSTSAVAAVARPKQVGAVNRTQRSMLGDIANKKKTVLPAKTTAPAAAKPKTRTLRSAKPEVAGAIQPTVQEIKKEKVDVESLSTAFSSKILQITDIDEPDENDPFLLPQYVNDIYDYLRSLEQKSKIKPNFLSGNLVDGRMRGILVDWLVQVHARFSLLQETLFLAVAVLDMYLQDTCVLKEKLQLVGVTALYIASKYEEIYAPDITDFVYISDYTYKKPEVLQMEREILRKIDFRLGRPSALHFLRRNTKAAFADARQHTMAKYFIELALVDYGFAHYDPSLTAAAALYLSLKLDNAAWTDTLAHYSKYDEPAVLPVARKLAVLVTRATTLRLQPSKKGLKAVTHKYADDKLLKVSMSLQLDSCTVSKMASEAD